MPQFDSYSFSGQVFWSILGYYFFYFFILKFYLSNFSEMFKFRQKLINCYLTKNNKNKHSINYLNFFFISKINN